MQTDETKAREVLKGLVLLHGALDADAAIDAMLAFASAPPDGERVESIALDVAETITAHMRSPDMIWGLGRIDTELLDEMEGELRSITVAALTNAILALSPTPSATLPPATEKAEK